MRVTIVHQGVPIGAADLPEGRRWSGGLLEPLPAFEAIRPTIEAAAAGAEVALRLLTLPAGEAPAADDLAPPLDDALRRAAALTFELRDEGGLAVAAHVVRLADPGDGRGVRVRAYFRDSTAGVPARPALAARRGGGSAAREG